MYKGNKICVVVPAYNEEKFILKVINTMPKSVDHIVVVDDASTDSTYTLVSNFEDGRVVAIRHKVNQGVGGAIITGHKKALEMDGDISVVMAGDAQMDPKYLPDLLDPIIEGGYHYTKGNKTYNNWTYHEEIITTPVNISDDFFIRFYGGGDPAVWIDDISFVEDIYESSGTLISATTTAENPIVSVMSTWSSTEPNSNANISIEISVDN